MTNFFNKKAILSASVLFASTIIAGSANAFQVDDFPEGYIGYSKLNQVYGSSVANQSFAANRYDFVSGMLQGLKYGAFGYNFSTGDEKSTISNVWTNVYGVDEDIDLDGNTINNNTYGIVVGSDSDVKILENGTKSIYSVYAGYADSEQKFGRMLVDQDAVNIGARALFVKNKWFGGAIADLGMSFATEQENNTKADFETYTATLAANVGYSYDFYCNTFALQPSLTVAYLYMNTPDYTNVLQAKTKTDDLHALFLSPELKFLVNLDGRSSAYVAASYNWNTTSGGDVNVAGLALEELGFDSYGKYSIGYQNNAYANVSGYAEMFATSGSRDGYGGEVGVKLDF